jgi:hypothetical protein
METSENSVGGQPTDPKAPVHPAHLALVSVPFQGGALLAAAGSYPEEGDRPVPLAPFCERLGINADTQRKKLARVTWTCPVVMTVQIPGDDQARRLACIPLRALAGWLFTINPGKVARPIVATADAMRDALGLTTWSNVEVSALAGPGQRRNPRLAQAPRRPPHRLRRRRRDLRPAPGPRMPTSPPTACPASSIASPSMPSDAFPGGGPWSSWWSTSTARDTNGSPPGGPASCSSSKPSPPPTPEGSSTPPAGGTAWSTAWPPRS